MKDGLKCLEKTQNYEYRGDFIENIKTGHGLA